MEDRGPTAYIAELVGTFMLVLFIALIASVYARKGIGTPEFVTIGLLHAFVLMMLIQTLGGTSGGHFNPAVTAGLLAVRKIKPSDAGVYVVMQVIGAIAARGAVQSDPERTRPDPEPRQPLGQPVAGRQDAARRAGRAGGRVRARVGGDGRRRERARDARLGGVRDRHDARLRRAGDGAADGRQPEPGARARPRDRRRALRQRLRRVLRRLPAARPRSAAWWRRSATSCSCSTPRKSPASARSTSSPRTPR